ERVQVGADPRDLLGRRLPRAQRLLYEQGGRAAEGALEEIPEQLALGLFGRGPRRVHVGPLALIATDQALLRHDLQELQDGGVAELPAPGQPVVDLADRARTALPEHSQDLELGSGGSHRGFACHVIPPDSYTRKLVRSFSYTQENRRRLRGGEPGPAGPARPSIIDAPTVGA